MSGLFKCFVLSSGNSVISCILFVMCSLSFAQETSTLKVIGWNVDSGGADPNIIAKRIEGIQGFDIWGLSEVQNEEAAKLFTLAAGNGENNEYANILGTTGNSDRLLILYNTDRLEEVKHFELDYMNIDGNARAPLVALFLDRLTAQEFFFMVNHLDRKYPLKRHQQAQLLNEWAQKQELPIIAVGCYNFDWHVANGDRYHDNGFNYLTRDGVFTWLRPPSPLVNTKHYEHHNSVLDFIFVAGEAFEWKSSSEIIVKEGDFPDDNTTSDHRPVSGIIEIPQKSIAKPDNKTIKQQITQQITIIENELAKLKKLLEEMP